MIDFGDEDEDLAEEQENNLDADAAAQVEKEWKSFSCPSLEPPS